MRVSHCDLLIVAIVVSLTFVASGSCVPRLSFQIPPVKFVPCYDMNGDGMANGKDAVVFGLAFGSLSGEANWNPFADFTEDGIVDRFDAVLMVSAFGTMA